MIRRTGLAALLALFGATQVDASETLGRLFFTAEKRAALDRERQLNIRHVERAEGAISLDGVVKRSSGRNTVWINGRPHATEMTRDGLAIAVGDDATRATVKAFDEPSTKLRVGEAVDRTTKEYRDSLRGGRIAGPGDSHP